MANLSSQTNSTPQESSSELESTTIGSSNALTREQQRERLNTDFGDFITIAAEKIPEIDEIVKTSGPISLTEKSQEKAVGFITNNDTNLAAVVPSGIMIDDKLVITAPLTPDGKPDRESATYIGQPQILVTQGLRDKVSENGGDPEELRLKDQAEENKNGSATAFYNRMTEALAEVVKAVKENNIQVEPESIKATYDNETFSGKVEGAAKQSFERSGEVRLYATNNEQVKIVVRENVSTPK